MSEATPLPADREKAVEEQQYICKTVSSLLPLYADAEHDLPNSLLGSRPDTHHIVEALKILLDVLMPGKMSPGDIEEEELGIFLMRRLSQAWRMLRLEIEKAIPFRWLGEAARTEGADDRCNPREESLRIILAFYGRIAAVRKLLTEDVRAAYEGDPAALTYAEVQLAYPGLLAIASHRLAHELYNLDVPVVPRIMSEWTHSRTGIDIHPGATIGHGFFIDHGTGVVIGETTEIGNNVKLYQGVTLGARSFPLDAQGRPIKHVKRHPVVEDNVVIYANATILGGETRIGHDSTVGGNVFMMESVPPHSFVGAEHPQLHIKQHSEKR